ncbi:type 2 isopentenyl-diphosphate Delta-isomerase [Limosilactobacillus fastidiosus]|uniref:Isopentenyl-diphosphate delta-isomerase n=1 Tax=Limosilactobacillus fastidiosus TaxID=2759855 RepID=A0A7W3YC73_9LACO|nr:type 2 isopentenyl-diphosphate Delta-isomerase [Limosilactobacillus fastidiosus]MBB1086459.1 type 2 isopentenyl-diphosphate Delta-isomerase [Limosilactobacillus fastidiosus]MCD7085189.1 type 2 isopentenyl-diphosphate Delta-isomerase [Limosilactobacillus fastidiosus]MCD7115047.1 type 2 isopentenyl-diphosphate Delta-isomerase [Limosilactobacillus fastidiosus]MCD7116269.1 type 2 isopentenyl-diphosphate Delta-isomerase [Limosilactobacillus fastidiosus]
MESNHAQRKNEHLSLATKLYTQVHTNSLDNMQIIHHSLPEISLKEVTAATSCGKLKFTSPFFIEAMTGGSQNAYKVNQKLAILAKKYRLAMAIGSASITFHDQAAKKSFSVVRETNPDGIIIANLSAKASLEQAKAVIELLNANALELHINTTQELIMSDGDRDFHWLANIESLINHLDVPIIVKEVGFGMDATTINQLQSIGVQLINISGRGGTNFAVIEDHRNHLTNFDFLNDWGQTTLESLLEARKVRKKTTQIIASGGICSPLDVVKAGILGASAVGVAGYFLNHLIRDGFDALDKEINNWQVTLPRLLALLGCRSFNELASIDFVLHGKELEYAQQRHLI